MVNPKLVETGTHGAGIAEVANAQPIDPSVNPHFRFPVAQRSDRILEWAAPIRAHEHPDFTFFGFHGIVVFKRQNCQEMGSLFPNWTAMEGLDTGAR